MTKMAKITEKDVEHVAALARLSLNEKQRGQYAQELAKILDYVGQLQKVSAKNVEPTAHVTGLANVSREDRVLAFAIPGRDLLSQAPAVEKGYLKVKAVLPE